MLVFFTALAMAASVAAADQSDFGDKDTAITFKYYDIMGNTTIELLKEMKKLGPEDPNTNERYAGFTYWYVTWKYAARSERGVCKVTRLRVKPRGRITLPRWTPPENASEELRVKWNLFITALKKHELQHVSIATRLSNKIKASAPELTSSLGCQDLKAKFQENFDKHSEYFMSLDREFDIRTDHGKTEGANLD